MIICHGIYVEEYEVLIWSNGFLLHNIALFRTGILIKFWPKINTSIATFLTSTTKNVLEGVSF